MTSETINVLQAIPLLALGVGVYAYGHKAGRKDGINYVVDEVRKCGSFDTTNEVVYGEVLPK